MRNTTDRQGYLSQVRESIDSLASQGQSAVPCMTSDTQSNVASLDQRENVETPPTGSSSAGWLVRGDKKLKTDPFVWFRSGTSVEQRYESS